jgi:hypothetical protein
MKFVLFVEGYTEAMALPAFLKKWLDPRLKSPVRVQPVRFEGWSELVRDVALKAKMHLDRPSKDKVIAVISLLDLYGPTFYPNHIRGKDERYDWAKRDMEKSVGEDRFFQFFAVHEVEAWLLSQPEIFPSPVSESLKSRVTKPEDVNSDNPPAKLLERLYHQHAKGRYKKLVHGAELFQKLDPSVAYSKCPRLKEMLDKMLELASE